MDIYTDTYYLPWGINDGTKGLKKRKETTDQEVDPDFFTILRYLFWVSFPMLVTLFYWTLVTDYWITVFYIFVYGLYACWGFLGFLHWIFGDFGSVGLSTELSPQKVKTKVAPLFHTSPIVIVEV